MDAHEQGADDCVTVGVEIGRADVGEQTDCVGDAARREPVLDRGVGVVVVLIPTGRGGVDRFDPLGLANTQLVAQDLPELRVDPIGAVAPRETLDEEVGALEVVQHIGRVGPARHALTQTGREVVEARRLHEEPLDFGRLRGEHLVEEEFARARARRRCSSAGPPSADAGR